MDGDISLIVIARPRAARQSSAEKIAEHFPRSDHGLPEWSALADCAGAPPADRGAVIEISEEKGAGSVVAFRRGADLIVAAPRCTLEVAGFDFGETVGSSPATL
jgi:hypothetical protein